MFEYLYIETHQLLKVNSDILIDKDLIEKKSNGWSTNTPSEVISVSVPNIATIKATIWPFHLERGGNEEVASTMFQVSLDGRVMKEVYDEKRYSINWIMKIEVKHSDSDEDISPFREKVVAKSYEAICAHRATLVSGRNNINVNKLRLKYAIYLTKNL